MPPGTTRTTCPYCGVGCGVLVDVSADGAVTVKGDPEHPANFGRLCSKGAALAETLDHEGRMLVPEIDGHEVSWEQALDHVAQRLQEIQAEHGRDAVALYVSGQLLTEDYYVANKLAKGFLGTANIDTNSRLCMSSAVAAYKRAFGSDTVPCTYEDLERAKLIVLTGSNTAWCHPVLFQRIRKAKKENPDLMIIVIDPRETPTCDIADLHLPLRAGSDTALFNGLLLHLDAEGERNQAFVNHATNGVEAALAAAREDVPHLADVAQRCGLDESSVAEFYRLFARTERVVTVFSQGVNQFSYGTDKGNSIINCHLLSGRIGRPGMGPFSFTGQPNAMGGREVGGLSNQLAAHMELSDPASRERVRRYWRSPKMPEREGYKATELVEAIEEGKVRALWIMATNPAVSLPDSQRVRAALAKCELLIVSDCMRETDTTQFADVLLPAQTWGEKDGTVTNSERRISRQRAFLSAPRQARPDWWVLSEVAQRMGFGEAFAYAGPDEIFREHAGLSGFENQGQRDFDISALAELDAQAYAGLSPVQWPVNAQAPTGTARMFGDGRYFTEDGRARFVPVTRRDPLNPPDRDYPLVLNTGRVRDQWHTMTRTGKSPRLGGHIVEPYAELSPADAVRIGVEDGGLARVRSAWGDAVLRVRVQDTQRTGNVFVPIHWNQQFSSLASVDMLVNPALDPWSGQPEFKHTPVRVDPYTPAWYGFLLSRRRLDLKRASYWACSRGKGLWRYELAGEEAPGDWAGCARELLCGADAQVSWAEYFDSSANRYRAARLVGDSLESCIFIGPEPALPSRDWLIDLFAEEYLDESQRMSLLTGRPGVGATDKGRVVCACFGVGEQTLQAAITEHGLTTPEQIGERLQAGTNCGSCVPELRALIERLGKRS